METPVKNKSGDNTGVSRSGRVRKKSSKLTDFESPDEIDTRFKRKTDRPQKSQKSIKIGQAMGSDIFDDSDSYIDDEIEVKDEPLEVDDWGENYDGDDICDDGDDRDDGNDPLHVDDDSTDMPRETSNYSQAQSLYFSEKQGKKNIMLKDGQVVRRKKAQRKDKGKSRFTAYMLWAREIRPGIIQANPNMDFSAVNKRLGELWALVPTTQKYNWKRRAKRLAAKGNQKGSMISTGKAAKQAQNTARSNLINKGGVKPQQVIRTSSKQPEAAQPAPAATQKTQTITPKASRATSNSAVSENSPPSTYKVTGNSPIDVAAHIKLLGESLNNIGQKLKEHESLLEMDKFFIKKDKIENDDNEGSVSGTGLCSKKQKTGSVSSKSVVHQYQTTCPSDSFHLKKNNLVLCVLSVARSWQTKPWFQGQIAVSGSLSVLLDSMLCVLGPLTCLTAQVSQMQGAVPEATLMNILDNIAYIMPGIV